MKRMTRSERLYDAISLVRSEMEGHDEVVVNAARQVQDSLDRITTNLGDVLNVMAEYVEWKDNLEEAGGLSQSATFDKLEDVCQALDNLECIDFNDGDDLKNAIDEWSGWDELEDALDETENLDLPIGFGRD